MRILLITSMVPDATGGGAIPKLVAAQLEGLTGGHEVTLVSSFGEEVGQAEAAQRLLDDGFDAHFVDRRRAAGAGRRWRVRAGLAATWATRGWPWRVVCGAGGLQPVLDRLGAEREFDVVAVEDNPVAVLRFPAGVPTVLTEHEAVRAPASAWRGEGGLVGLPERVLRERDWRRWERFLPTVWRRFDLVQVFCEGDARAIRERAPELVPRTRVNPYGMILPATCDPAQVRPGTVLFAGTFGHLPNREAAAWLAREIMPAVRRSRPDAVLRLVGIAPPPEVLALVGPGVELVADAASMEPHLEQAAVVLAPVRSGGGMRMKVLEAMARGKAVVTTPLGAEGFNCFEEAPPLALGADTEAIAAATAELLGDDGARCELGACAREFALRHHSAAAWASRLERLYDEARAGGGRQIPNQDFSQGTDGR